MPFPVVASAPPVRSTLLLAARVPHTEHCVVPLALKADASNDEVRALVHATLTVAAAVLPFDCMLDDAVAGVKAATATARSVAVRDAQVLELLECLWREQQRQPPGVESLPFAPHVPLLADAARVELARIDVRSGGTFVVEELVLSSLETGYIYCAVRNSVRF